jgi:hypothetical protein
VTTPGLKASDGRISLGLTAGEDEQTFSSVIARADTLELSAGREASYAEHWRFAVGSTWHVEFAGMPPVRPEEEGGAWTFEYYPRPGEHLSVHVTRPAAVAGGTVAFDRVRFQTVVGKRSGDATLQLAYRSTQGGRHALHLPEGASVTRVLSDGEPVALRPEQGELSLIALPGTHSWSIDWRTTGGAALVTRAPAVDLSAPAGNLSLSVQLPEDRWVLYTVGPGVGPTILYWSELLVFVIAAWLVGRSGLTPLPTADWLLLGLGLSTFSWLALAVFALFIGVFQWRARHPATADADRFRLLQVGTGLLAVIAILAVVRAVPQGLLGHPDMRIEPAGRPGELTWFVDQTAGAVPTPGVLSLSLWWYKLAMLGWALWLSFALTRWVKWAWRVFTRDGLWPSDRDTPRPEQRAPEPAADPAAGPG